MVPEMAHAGDGYNFHVTGLTHDERGYPNMTPQVQDKLVRRLQNKIRIAADRICLFEEERLGGRGCGGGFLRHHFAGGAAGDRRGPRTGLESRQAAPDHRVALPREEDCASLRHT